MILHLLCVYSYLSCCTASHCITLLYIAPLQVIFCRLPFQTHIYLLKKKTARCKKVLIKIYLYLFIYIYIYNYINRCIHANIHTNIFMMMRNTDEGTTFKLPLKYSYRLISFGNAFHCFHSKKVSVAFSSGKRNS